MKQFLLVLLCVLVTLAASATLLWLVSAPVGTEAEGEGHGEETHAEAHVEEAAHDAAASAE